MTVVNQGTISGEEGSRIVDAENVSILNSGLIESSEVLIGTNALQIDSSINADVVNSGTIRNSTASPASAIATAAMMFNSDQTGSRFELTNTGLISGPNWALHSRAETTEVTNGGFLDGGVNVEILPGATARFDNTDTGVVAGDVQVFSEATVINSGIMRGSVTMSAEADSFRGFGGTVTGSISGGDGDDQFFIDQADADVDGGGDSDTVYLRSDLGSVADVELIQMQGAGGYRVFDDDSATQINGNSGNNLISGAGGNDTLRGGQGNDDLRGGDDDDLIIGNSGDDEIDAGNGADTVFGGVGNDEILGGFGNDLIAGGAGDDTILSGRAQDTISGGGGADTFVFEDALDAGSGSSADRIDNFVRGVDVIDLIALGSTPASFIGTTGFSGGGDMEVRYTVNPFGNALVRIDEDGNGTEDARIVVSQTAMLEAGDFLL